MSAMTISLVIATIALYIYFYKKEEFKELVIMMVDSIFFAFALMFEKSYDIIIPTNYGYNRTRKVDITSTIVNTENLYHGGFQYYERKVGRKQRNGEKNRRTIKKRLSKM